MVLVVLGAGWLLVSGVLGVLAAIKLHAPGMLAGHAWLTYGRLQPAAWNAFAFGFATPVGLALSLWIMARLSQARLPGGWTIILGAVVWQVGLKLGLLGILSGDTTGYEGLELPRYASPILFAGYLLIAPWAFITFARRRVCEAYISQWYLLAALVIFPWVFAAGHLATSFFPLRGVLQAAAQAWYLQNLYAFWFGFLGLGFLFYFIPKLARAEVPSRNLALFGFWTALAFGGLGGLTRYSGGPFPAWMSSIAVVASVLGLFPLYAVAANLFRTVGARSRGNGVPAGFGPLLPALGVFLILGVCTAINAFATVRHTTHFTLVGAGLDLLALHGFFGLAAFGGLCFVVPRVLGVDWASPALGRLQNRLWIAGTLLVLLAFLPGGVLQGVALDNPDLAFSAVLRRYLPFASTGTLAQLLFLAAAGLFVLNLVLSVYAAVRSPCVAAFREWAAPAAREVKA